MYIRVSGLIIKHTTVLVTGYEYPDGVLWHLPGGKVEHSESLPDALRREFREELGVEIDVSELLFVCEEYGKKRVAHVVFKAEILSGVPSIQSRYSKADYLEYLDLNKIKNLYPNIVYDLIRYKSNIDNGSDGGTVYLGMCQERDWL